MLNYLIAAVKSRFWYGVTVEPTTSVQRLQSVKKSLVSVSSFKMNCIDVPLTKTLFF